MDKILEGLPGARKNILLKNYTSFKIGGLAKYFLIAKTKEELINALRVARDFKLPVFILGGGSNILISDKGFKGLVIKIDISGIKFQDNRVLVGAGENSTKLAYLLADKGFSGLEWAAGMPGTVGGSVHGNAHAFGTSMSDLIEQVQALDFKTLELKNFTKEQCHFDSKNSIFKKNKRLVIVSAVLQLKQESPDKIKNKIKEFLEYRRVKHPMNFPSAGSVFINPENNQSWRLVKDSGLSGKKIGGAQISEKHTNFIVNLGSAKAKDVVKLIKLVQQKVKKTFKTNLETEIELIGF